MNSGPMIPFAFFALVLTLIGSVFLFLYYTTLRRPAGFLAWVVTFIVAIIVPASTVEQNGQHFERLTERVAIPLLFMALLILFGTAFCIRLYRKWLYGAATPDELAPGAEGLRAWLSPANLAVAGAITFAAWKALGWSPVLTVTLTLGLLLIWPAFHNQSTHPAVPASTPSPNPTNAAEREKVLALLEAGKISADESAELLHALAASSAQPAAEPRGPMSGNQKLALAGGVLVLIGFFLPWFSINPASELKHAMSDLGFAGSPLESLSQQFQGSVVIRGGDIGDKLGWVVLILGLIGPILPQITPHMDPTVQRTIRMLALGAGAIILLYLISQQPRSVSFGIVLALAGYICQGLAVRQSQRREVAASGTPVGGI
jgi:hypothetical protein